MPATKDKERGTWTAQFYYTDYTGTRKKKKKRGFKLQREALDFERDFLAKHEGDCTMTFGALVDLYLEDMGHRLKASTLESKEYIVGLKILPYFKDKPLDSISPTDIRKWQNELLGIKNPTTGEGYAPTYLKTINNQIVAIFNYAVKYYDLKCNPCHKAGTIGKKNAEEMDFWTVEEFKAYAAAEENPIARAAVITMFYTGVRVGELTALTWADIDLEKEEISVTKSKQLVKGETIISTPKTPKSERVIPIPPFLVKLLEDYKNSFYDHGPDETAFNITKSGLLHRIKVTSAKVGIKRIRVHDLRHSHASLLIELGFSPLLIAERLGHERVETTLNTYAHLWPHKQAEIVEKLESHGF